MPTDIFLSRPTIIPGDFEMEFVAFEKYLARKGYRTRRLGANQYSMAPPLVGVMNVMKTCRGAIILGYPQYEFTASLLKAQKPMENVHVTFPTPWNQIEGALAFSQSIPVLIVAHEGVSGGVFDHGVTGQYVIVMKLNQKGWYKTKEFQGVFHDWAGRIS